MPAELALVISLAGFVAGWQLVVLAFDYPPFILPSPVLVAQRIADELAGGTLLHHTGVTVRAALSGYGYAAVISIALGYLLAADRRIERIVAPQLAATQAIPVVAVAPLIILWLGNGPEALTRVKMIGNDLALDTGVGVCGKEGQSVPVGVGQPTLRIDRLTVGGTA